MNMRHEANSHGLNGVKSLKLSGREKNATGVSSPMNNTKFLRYGDSASPVYLHPRLSARFVAVFHVTVREPAQIRAYMHGKLSALVADVQQ